MLKNGGDMETKRIRVEMVEDAQNKEVSNVTPEKENAMAKETV